MAREEAAACRTAHPGETGEAKRKGEALNRSVGKETISLLLAQMKKSRRSIKEVNDVGQSRLREKHTEAEDLVKRLVESMSVAGDTSAK